MERKLREKSLEMDEKLRQKDEEMDEKLRQKDEKIDQIEKDGQNEIRTNRCRVGWDK